MLPYFNWKSTSGTNQQSKLSYPLKVGMDADSVICSALEEDLWKDEMLVTEVRCCRLSHDKNGFCFVGFTVPCNDKYGFTLQYKYTV